jgi:hypothetical protein
VFVGMHHFTIFFALLGGVCSIDLFHCLLRRRWIAKTR